VGCRGCEPKTSDGIGTVAWLNGVTQLQAAKQLAEIVGLEAPRWTWNKPGIKPEAIKVADGRFCEFAGKRCVQFAVTPDGEDGKTSGRIYFRGDGQPFDAYRELPERKSHNKKGSKDGWLIVGRDTSGRPVRQSAAIEACETIWCVEGIPDALALWCILPNGHAAASNICGATTRGKLSTHPVAGKTCYVIGDSDEGVTRLPPAGVSVFSGISSLALE